MIDTYSSTMGSGQTTQEQHEDAEIVASKSHHINDYYDDGFQGCRTNVLQILDKYKAESEETDI